MRNNETEDLKPTFTSTEDVQKNLKEVLDTDAPSVSVIKGDWGVGKTHFVKNFLKSSGIKHVYVSLFNKNSLQDIEKEISLKLSSIVKIASVLKEKFPSHKNFFQKMAEFISPQLSWMSLLASIGIESLLFLLETKDFKNVVIVFDDLERISKNLPLEEILGFISVLKEEKECKVILIFNEKEITNADAYNKYKEKIVDYEFLYNPPVEENWKIVENRFKCYKEEVKEFFQRYNINNIRSMLQVSFLINKLCNIGLNEYGDLGIQTIRYLTPFIYLKKVKNKTPQDVKKMIEDYQSQLIQRRFERVAGNITPSENSKDQKEEEIIRLFSYFEWPLFGFSFYPPFIEAFFEFIDTEVLTNKTVEEIKAALNEEKKLTDLEEELKEYKYSVRYKDKEFFEKVKGIIEKHKQEKIDNVFYLQGLLSKLEWFSQLDKDNTTYYQNRISEVVKNFMEHINEGKFLELRRHRHQKRIIKTIEETIRNKYPELHIWYERKKKEIHKKFSESCEKMQKLMNDILYHQEEWNEDYIEIIDNIPLEILHECINNPEFVRTLLEFVKEYKFYSHFKGLVEKFNKLLDDLDSQTPDIKEKINLWKQYINS